MRARSRPRASSCADGALVALPTSPGAFLTTGAFTLGAKLRLLREPFIAAAPPEAEESIAAFVRRRLGTEFLDYAIDPFVSGIYAGDPEQISVPAAFPRLHALEQKYGSLIRGQIKGARERRQNAEKAKNAAGSFSFDRGMQTFPSALAGRLARYLPGARVESIVRVPAATTTCARSAPARRSRSPRARSWSAAPAYRAAAFLRDAVARRSPARSRRSATRRSRSSPPPTGAPTSRHDARRLRLPGAEEGAPARSSARCSRAACSRAARRRDTVLLTTFIGGLRNPECRRLPTPSSPALVAGELAALVGARRAAVARDRALDARDPAVHARAPRADRGGRSRGRGLARAVLVRELARRRVGERLRQERPRDGRDGAARLPRRPRAPPDPLRRATRAGARSSSRGRSSTASPRRRPRSARCRCAPPPR